MQDADNLFFLAAIEGYARMRAGQRLHHQLARIEFHVQHLDVLAVDHHVFDGEFLEVERTDKAQPVCRLDAAFEGMKVDGAADFLIGRDGLRRRAKAQQLQRAADDHLDRLDDPGSG
ncbi:MAG: hypothetical protein R3C04_03930 [Hyphomonas sp.]